MRIVISSHAFAPSVGGIETVGALLALEFVNLGHEVIVVTQTPGKDSEPREYRVIRQPSAIQLWRAVSWGNIFWHNNLSIRTIWPSVLLRRPLAITHHGSYCRQPIGPDLVQRVKHMVVGRTTSIAVSKAVANCFHTPSTVIPNPYDARAFRPPTKDTERSQDLVFVGRLITEKGVDLLLQALHWLRSRRVFPSLTIIGNGPERAKLERLTARLGLFEQVSFAGAKRGEELVNLLHRHKILVVPSRYNEPFGIVAVEGIACGCVVVASSGGGLPEAIGPCGITFPNGDVEAMGQTLEKLLLRPDERQHLLGGAASHLSKFEPATVAQTYLNLFQSLL